MVDRIKTTVSIALLTAFIACAPRGDAPRSAGRVSPPPPPVQVAQLQEPDLATLNNIPANASREQMDHAVSDLMSAFSASRISNLNRFTSYLSALKNQPQLVFSIVDYYDKLPNADHRQRMATLAILGELRRPDALPFLQRVVWAPMPGFQPANEGLTPRDLEEMVMVKALHGLGYMRKPEADKILIDVMLRHESRGLRIAAIDSYMWNHDDSNEADQLLYQTLPGDLHKFVERPRFHRDMDRTRFNEQLAAWRQKWGATN